MTQGVHAKPVEEIAALCAGCHGQNGVPISPDIPVIWGQHAGYMFLQLRDFKSGARTSPMMQPMAAELSREDMMALAVYFDAKTWPNLGQPSASAPDAARAKGDIASGQCTQCHLGGFLGDSTNPRLAGQSVVYLQATMQAFHDGTRANNPWMNALLKTYAADDLTALAHYLGGL